MSKFTTMVGSWDKFMAEIFNNVQVIGSLNTLNYFYSNHTAVIYPKQVDVFKAFVECPYEKLAAVIILQDPYHDGSATGIAVANNLGSKLSPSLRIIKDTVSKTVYNRHEFDFDSTLVSWAQQGVLLLNTALTVERGKPLSHQRLWSKFTELVLTKLSQTNCGIVYCLWGKHAKFYSQYIDDKANTILEATHPVYAAYSGKSWECNHFQEINKYLKGSNNLTITW